MWSISAVVNLPTPEDIEQLRLDALGFRCKFFPMMCKRTDPIVALLQNGTFVNLTSEVKAIVRDRLTDVASPLVLFFHFYDAN